MAALLQVLAARHNSAPVVEQIQVKVAVGGLPRALPAELRYEPLARLNVNPVALIPLGEVHPAIRIGIGKVAVPDGSAVIARRARPDYPVFHRHIHALERAVREWRSPVAGAVPSPAKRIVDNIHVLLNHPADAVAKVAQRIRVGYVERGVGGYVNYGFGYGRAVRRAGFAVFHIGRRHADALVAAGGYVGGQLIAHQIAQAHKARV